MFIADVALGKMAKYKNPQSHLTEAPKGYDSVMGEASVKQATWNALVHNEYVIYNTNQQRLAYLVGFTARAYQ